VGRAASSSGWAHRENNSGGFSVEDVRVQFSFTYSFGYKIGG